MLPVNHIADFMSSYFGITTLGVSLKGATEGAVELQTAGLIDYTQGRIRVIDRAGLERRVCECYAVVKKEYDRLLPERLAA
jgi:hypothetical protein